MSTELDGLLTVRQAAQRCRRSPETIRRWIWDGKLPARKVGNQLFIRAGDLAAAVRPHPLDASRNWDAALAGARAVREAIARRTACQFDVVAALHEERESHP